MKKVISLAAVLVMTLGFVPQFTVPAMAAKPVESSIENLRFDDHVDLSGKTVEIIDAGAPTSYQVGYGVEENTVLDTAVVTLEGNKLVATGIGTARVNIDGVEYEINVTEAPISLMLVIGQSNARGSEGNAAQSIVCPDGMVYSTFGDDRGSDNAIMTEENAARFAASALTGSYSKINVEGTTENLSSHPIHALTDAGSGKVGLDSGLAYEWVQETGEKVWVVNAAHGGTGIGTWLDGTVQFEEAEKLFKACQETLRKEIAAGHYTLSHMGYYWCQGCGNAGGTAEYYVDNYLRMHESLKTEMAFDHDSNPSTEPATFEFGGIIPVRAAVETSGYRNGVYDIENIYPYHESFKDIRFTGPRVAQYWMGNNPDLEDIWVVCNLGDDWVWMPDGTNGVKAYFDTQYENGVVDYTTQVSQKEAWYTPSTPGDVHDAIHYNQVGYNELGRESVRNTLIMLGEAEAPQTETTVEFLTWDGFTKADKISAATKGDSSTLVVPIVSPIWNAKQVTYSLTDGLSYRYYDLLADGNDREGTLSAAGAEGSVKVQGHIWSEWKKTDVSGDQSKVVLERTCSHCGLVQTKQQETVWSKFKLGEYLSSLPDIFCCDINIWDLVEHNEANVYHNGSTWTSYGGSTGLEAITIPVQPGDKIYSSSYISGIRTTFFDEYGVAKSYDTAACKGEFEANGGYLIAPEGAIAVNIPIYNNRVKEVRILNRDHELVKGICQACGEDKHEHEWSEWSLKKTPGPGEEAEEESVCTICGLSETRYVKSVWQKFNLEEHYSELPEDVCCDLNIWDVLEHDEYFLSSGIAWATHSAGLSSVTFPVNEGDKIYASSFITGIRMSFLDAYGVVKTYDTATCKAEFTANGGYLEAPEGTIAVNIPFYDKTAVKEIYILNRDHIYDSNGRCVACEDPVSGPVIICQPQETETVLHQNYSISVEAEGEELTYQWYFKNPGSDKWNKSSVTDSFYTNKMTEERANREVYCVITDAYGNKVKTDIVTIACKEYTELKIITQPVDSHAPMGQEYSIEVEAQGDDLTYQWYFKNPDSDKWSKSEVTESVYSNTMTKARAGREVYCIVTDAYGNKVKSDVVSLICGPEVELTITAQVADVEVPLGETYCITVEAQGEELKYQWYFKEEGSEKWTKSTVTENVYTNTMTKTRAGRDVYCVITDAYGNKVTTDIVTLTIAEN